MTDSVKSRELSTAEYFTQVQKEYLIAWFRSKIYFNPKNKRYWRKVMSFKAEKIEQIAKRNNLNSILNSEKKMSEFQESLFDSNGKPKFEMNQEDLRNYFTIGNEFSYNGEIYTLDLVNGDELVLLDSGGEKIVVNKDDVCRII